MIQKLNQKIKKALSPYENALERLREIPGLSRKTVEGLIAEIGLDIEVFPTEQHLCSWVDVSPGNNESAGKKSGRNKQSKTTLMEASWAATRTKGTFYKARYHRLAARRGKKRAAVAVATLHSQIGLSRAQRRCALPLTRGQLFRLPNGRQAEKVPQKGT